MNSIYVGACKLLNVKANQSQNNHSPKILRQRKKYRHKGGILEASCSLVYYRSNLLVRNRNSNSVSIGACTGYSDSSAAVIIAVIAIVISSWFARRAVSRYRYNC